MLPPKHMINISVTLTNPPHSDYVTTPQVAYALIIPSCINVGGNGPVIMEVINDSYETYTLRPGREIAKLLNWAKYCIQSQCVLKLVSTALE